MPRSILSPFIFILTLCTAGELFFFSGSIPMLEGTQASSVEASSTISHERLIDSHLIDARAAATFQKLATHEKGVLPKLPIEICMRRQGPIKQEIRLSSDGILTVIVHFAYSSIEPSSDKRVKASDVLVPCVSTKSFNLSDFSQGKNYRYEINSAMKSIVLYDGSTPCYVAFQNKSDFDSAVKIFSILINETKTCHIQSVNEGQSTSQKSLSEIAQEAGFRWIAVLPRYKTLDEMFDQLGRSKNPLQEPLVFWLTKKDPEGEAQELLKEANNISPIFLYPLSHLDDCRFITLPFIGAVEPAIFSSPYQLQSISSSDSYSFLYMAKNAEFLPIRVDYHPPFHTPSIIISRSSDTRSITRALKKRQLGQLPNNKPELGLSQSISPSIIAVTPRFFFEELPEGSTLKWLTGISPSSDDCLRELFFDRSRQNKEIFSLLHREYPFLKTVLQAQSQINQGMSIQASLIEEMKKQDDLFLNDLITPFFNTDRFSYERIKLSLLFALEASLLYGDASASGRNGAQYAIIMMEKLGAPWHQVIAIEALLNSIAEEQKLNPVLMDLVAAKEPYSNSRTEHVSLINKMKAREVLISSALLKETKSAVENGIPLHEWLKVKAAFLTTLYHLELFKPVAALPLHDFHKFILQLPPCLKDGCVPLPLGIADAYRCKTARSVYGAYYWEKKDTLHRDGLALKRAREKYEEHLIHHPSSEWRDKFWEWLESKQSDNKQKRISSTHYVAADERAQYEARFENGVLVHPQQYAQEQEIEVMFVVGLNGKIYLGKKIDAEDDTTPSFNHASFFQGNPVASAGKIVFQHGRPTLMTDHSGHYRPKRKEVIIAVHAFKNQGVDLSLFSVLHSASSTEKKLWKSAELFLKEMDGDDKERK